MDKQIGHDADASQAEAETATVEVFSHERDETVAVEASAGDKKVKATAKGPVTHLFSMAGVALAAIGAMAAVALAAIKSK